MNDHLEMKCETFDTKRDVITILAMVLAWLIILTGALFLMAMS